MSSATVDLQLPPGFRFHPTDEELVMHYLCRKCASLSISVPIIAEINLYRYDPWDLPGLALYGEKEWYFFSPRDRKYPNGSRPNRAAGTGYWKATGADKPIGHPKPVGIKKALVFYSGKAPRGEKSNWIMHEYRLADVDRSARKKNNSLRLDDWVLCRIYNKKGTVETHQQQLSMIKSEEMNPNPSPCLNPMMMKAECKEEDLLYLGASDSIPRNHTESSCSDHVLSPDVESAAPQNLLDWEKVALEFPYNYMDTNDLMGGSQFHGGYHMVAVQQQDDVYSYGVMNKPF